MKLFSGHVQDQSESVAVEGQATRAKRSVEDQAIKAQSSDSDQALKASDSDQISPNQPELEANSPSSVQFKTNVSISSNSQDNHCRLAVSRSSINIDRSLMDKIHCLLQKEIVYKDILEEMESTRKMSLYGYKKNTNYKKSY